MTTETLADQSDLLNILYYGDGGTGKTTALAHMAHHGRVLYIDAESGIKKRPLQKLGVPVENIELFPKKGQPFSFAELEDEYWRIASELDDDPDSYAGVILDSGTEVYKRLLEDIVEYQNERARSKGSARVKDAAPGDMVDRFFIDRGDYGIMTEQIRRIVRRFRDLDCHFGISCLERREQDDDGEVLYVPSLTPALQNDIYGYMDIVCHTSTAEVAGVEEYHGRFRPHGKYRGKDRWGSMPHKGLIDPTFDRVHAYVTEDLTLDIDPVMEEAKLRRQEKEKK